MNDCLEMRIFKLHNQTSVAFYATLYFVNNFFLLFYKKLDKLEHI